MKKTMMFVIMLAAFFLVMPAVNAAEVEYPTVDDITNANTFRSGTVTVSDIVDGTLTITVENAEFKLLGVGDAGELRPDNYAWVGLHFTFPENTENWKIDTESYDGNEFDEYFGFNVANLTSAAQNKKDYEATWDLKWDVKDTGPTENTLTIKLVVKPENVTLVNRDAETEDWNETGYLTASNQVKVEFRALCPEEVGNDYSDYLYLPTNGKVTEKEVRALASLKKYLGNKYEIEGFYSDAGRTKKFDFSKEIATNTIVYIKMAVVKEEKNPATGDNLLTYVSLGVVALMGTLGTVVYLKKVNE